MSQEFKISRLRFSWVGPWASGIQYARDAVVSYNGKAYVCLTPHLSSNFTTDLVTNVYWNLVVQGKGWAGEWIPNYSYTVDSIVKYGGIVYQCVTAHNSAASYELGLEADQNKWSVLVTDLEYIGDWAPDTRYKANDIVKKGPDLWKTIAPHTSSSTFDDAGQFQLFLPGFEFLNAWDSSVVYQPGDVVTYGGYTYTNKTINNIGNIPSIDAADWLIDVKGYRTGGTWDKTTPYLVGDVVTVHGRTYTAIQDNTGQDPSNTITATTYNSTGSSGTTLKVASTSNIYPGMVVKGVGLTDTSLNIIRNILTTGLTTTPTYTWPDNGTSNATTVKDAAAIQTNRATIIAGISNWMNATYNSVWLGLGVAGQTKCQRDVGYIVDAITYDLQYGGTYQSTIAGNAYYSFGVLEIASGEKAAAIASLTQIATLMKAYTSSTSDTVIDSLTNLIAGIINTGTSSPIIYPSVSGESAAVQTTLSALQGAKATIQAATTAYISATYPDLVYDINLCSRDVGLIIDAVCYDLVTGSNFASYVAGEAYYRAQSINVTNDQLAPTLDTINYVKTAAQAYVDVSLVNASNLAFTRVYSVLANGMSSAPAYVLPTPTGGTGNGFTAGYFNAARLILANKQFLKDEVNAYMLENYNTLWTDTLTAVQRASCTRDIGYIVDALRYDLTYGGNLATQIAARSYYSNGVFVEQAVEKTAALAVQARIKAIISQIAQGVAISVTTGNTTAQYTGGTAGSSTAGGVAQTRIQEIYDTINTGVSPATVAPDITWVNATLSGYNTTIQAQKASLQTAIISWINTSFSSLVYNQATCSRDIGYIIDAIRYDLMFGSNFLSIWNAMSYYRALTSTTVVLTNQLRATIGSINYLASLIDNLTQAPGFTQKQTVVSVVDATTLKLSSGPDGTMTNGQTLNFVGVNGAYWNLLVPEGYWSNIWTASTVYNIDDIVLWRNVTYTCVQNHTSTVGTQPDLDPSHAYWAYYAFHSRKNQLYAFGQIEAFNNSNITTIDIGDTGQLLRTNSNSYPQWTYINRITNVFYVAPNGTDRADYGRSIDQPFKTIGYACNYILQGTLFQNTQYLVNLNKNWIIAELYQWMLYQKANNNIPFTTLSTFDAIKSKRDASFVIDALISDLVHGGNSQTVQAALSYFQQGTTNLYFNAATTAAMPYIIASLTKLLELINYAITNTAPPMSYQVANDVVPLLQVSQQFNLSYTAESTAYDALSTLLGFITTALTLKDTSRLPVPNTGISSTINVKTGTFSETLPIVVPAGTALFGDELRSTVVEPKVIVNTVVTETSASEFTVYTTANMYDNCPVQFTGTLGDVTAGQTYYVIGSSITATTFSVSTVPGGPAIALTPAVGYVSGYMNVYGGDAVKDFFRMRNATGIRNMTMTGLLGTLSAPNDYLIQNPTGGSYVSLDPGTGPDDTSTWIIKRSPYVQNCTTFGQGAAGAKIDGALHNGGNKSMVFNDFTQVIQDGVGIWCTGSGALTECISVFCYFGYSGYLAQAGGRIRAANGNSSYGTFGLVAEGYDINETPATGIVFNRSTQVQASVQQSFGSNSQIVRLFYSNAGAGYKNPTTNLLNHSNDFLNAVWATDSNITVQKNTAAPTGQIEAWALTGTGTALTSYLQQAVAVTPPGQTFTGVTGVNLSGSGSGASFDVRITSTTYVVTVNNGGLGYVVSNQIKLDGATIGGLSGVNDLTITVASLTGSNSISTITSVGTVPAGSDRSFTTSVYIKQGNATEVDLYATFSGYTTVTSTLRYNFTTGVLTPGVNATAGFLPVNYGIIPQTTSGWFRLWFAFNDSTAANTTLTIRLYPKGLNGSTNTYNYYYGAQLELSETNYIPNFYLQSTNTRYTAYANLEFIGNGSNLVVIADELRSNAVFQTRIVANATGSVGGNGYLTASNNSQGGTNQSLVLAASDVNVAANYLGMRAFIISGTGAGQYGYISSYDFVTKTAQILKETFDSLSIISTNHSVASCTIGSISGNTFTTGGTIVGTFTVGMVLSGTGVAANTYITASGSTPGTYVVSVGGQSTGTIAITGTNDLFTLNVGYDTTTMYVNQPVQFIPTYYSLTVQASGLAQVLVTEAVGGVTNTFTVADTSAMAVNMPVTFTGTLFSTVTAGFTYYISNIIDSTTIQISLNPYGTTWFLSTDSGSMTLNYPANNNYITGSTSNMVINYPITFTGTSVGGISIGPTYYINDIIDGNNFTISTSLVNVVSTATYANVVTADWGSINGFLFTLPPSNTITVLSGTGGGAGPQTVTLTFAAQATPFQINQTIVVNNLSVSAWNGTQTVTAATYNTVSFLSTTSGSFSGGSGTINGNSVSCHLYGSAYTFTGTSINTPGTYTGVAQLSTSGSGVAATFRVVKTGTGVSYTTLNTTITVINPGSGYKVGDTVTLPGASLGGTTPANNLVLTITSVVGFQVGSQLTGPGITIGTYITSIISGNGLAPGQATVNISQTAGATQVTGTNNLIGVSSSASLELLNPISFSNTVFGGLIQDSAKYYIASKPDSTTLSITQALVTTTATATAQGSNLITVNSTANFNVNAPIKFVGLTFGGIVAETIYYIQTINDLTTFTISATPGGATINLSSGAGKVVVKTAGQTFPLNFATGSMVGTSTVALYKPTYAPTGNMNATFSTPIFGNVSSGTTYYVSAIPTSQSFSVSASAPVSGVPQPNLTVITKTGAMNVGTNGWDHVNIGTPIADVLDSSSIYYIEPRVKFSEPPFSQTATTPIGLSGYVWQSVAWGNYYWVAIPSGGTTAMRTQDGVTWSPLVLPTAATWSSIAYGLKTFVAISTLGSGTVIYSITDGLTWKTSSMPTASSWSSISYGNGKFVAIASGTNSAAYSTDTGKTWTASTLPAAATWVDMDYGSNLWVAISSGGNVLNISSSSSTGTKVTLNFAIQPSIPYTPGQKITVSGHNIGGYNGTWTVFSATTASVTFNSTATGSGTASGSINGLSLVAYSSDGITWNASSLPSNTVWGSITYGNNLFQVTPSASGPSAYSFDGQTWYSSNLNVSATKVAYGQGAYVALSANSGIAYVSEGGIGWKQKQVTNSGYSCAAFGFTPNNTGLWVTLAGGASGSIISYGSTAKGRVAITSSIITAINEWETGSGYTSNPTVTVSDPNSTSIVALTPRIASGTLGTPTFVNRGTGWTTSSTSVIVTGNGYSDQYQTGLTIILNNLNRLPQPGDSLTIEGVSQIYKVTSASAMFGTTAPNIEANVQISPAMTSTLSPANNTPISLRSKYSQIRATNHDFLNIGFGDQELSNYPEQPILSSLAPNNQAVETNYGRVFYTSTDQDGNFKVGTLFGVEQATGIVTLSASQFGLEGLTQLTLGGISVGSNAVVITQFSTDPTFTANSDNIIPTQKAIKSYLTSRLTQGGANTFTGQLIAGTVTIGGPNYIGSTIPNGTIGSQVKMPRVVNFSGALAGVSGNMPALEFFMANAFEKTRTF